MSGFPDIETEADHSARLVIVHADDSVSAITLGEDESWTETRTGIEVRRDGGRTSFPFATIKSYTIVYPDDTLGCPCGQAGRLGSVS